MSGNAQDASGNGARIGEAILRQVNREETAASNQEECDRRAGMEGGRDPGPPEEHGVTLSVEGQEPTDGGAADDQGRKDSSVQLRSGHGYPPPLPRGPVCTRVIFPCKPGVRKMP